MILFLRARLGVQGTLRMTRAGPDLWLQWSDVPGAFGYHVYEDVVKDGAFPRLRATAASGVPIFRATTAPEPLVFYRVTGIAGTAVGPK